MTEVRFHQRAKRASMDDPGERPAISDGATTWTFRQLNLAVKAMAARFADQIHPHEVIGLAMSAQVSSVAALLACRLAGRSAALLPPGLSEEERSAMASRAAARWLVVPAAGVAPMIEPHATDVTLSIPPSIIQTTSGSISGGRWAVRRWSSVLTEVRGVRALLSLDASDTVLCAASISHSYGLVGGLLAPLASGAHTVLAGPPASEAIGAAQPTVLFGLARTYQDLLESKRARDALRRTRFALSAGAPLPEGLFEAFRDAAGLNIRQDYGTTETGTIAIDSGSPSAPGTVGSPLPHIEVRLGEPPDAALRGDATREIQVRSRATADAYLEDGSLVACSDSAGWYHTRDAGSLTPAGKLVVGGRLREPIRIDGLSILPESIEAILLGLPGVREAVVLPVLGGQPGFKATVASAADAATLRTECEARLPRHLQPAEIDVRDALPRSPAGKVLQRYLERSVVN